MKLSQFLPGIGIIILIFFSLSGLYVNMGSEDNYNITIDQAFQGVYTNQTELNKLLQEQTGVAVGIDDKVQEAKDLPEDFSDPKKQRISAVLEAGAGGFEAIKSLFIETTIVLKLPPIILAVAILILTSALTFAIIAAIFNRNV